MRNVVIGLSTAAAILGIGIGAASAMPIAPNPAQAISSTEQVRLVCDRFGRCWRTGPRRYYRYGYGPRYRHYYGPRRYGYYGPRYYGRRYYGPGVTFRFGF